MTMSDVSSFVAQNSAWLIGIGAVLLLALIGFIADKNRSERIADWAYGLIPEKDHWTPANQQDRKG